MPSARKIHIKTYGCQMNVYDSERMGALLSQRGYEAEEDPRSADVMLINTCSIRDKAEQKVLSLLGQLKGIKAKRPKMVLGITGCVGQRMGRSLLQRVPHLDMVIGPDQIDAVPDLVDGILEGGARVVQTAFDKAGRSYSQPMAVPQQAKTSEFITIMKGCDHFCTYCIVPFVRGRETSRPIGEIVDDVRKLVAGGTKEVTFLGQNINTYGKGTGENLAQLIEAADAVDGLERIRYVTSHPRDQGDDVIAQFGTVEKLCPQLHLPFQAGSDRILKAMGRLYSRTEYLSKVDKLKKACPEIALSTDVIVGFPGETEADFEETLDVLKTVQFSGAFLFKYSERPGTKAVHLKDNVPEPVKAERLARAQEVVYPRVEAQNKQRIGSIQRVLIEGLDKKQVYFTGRTSDFRLVHVLNAGDACAGKLIDVEIIEANASNLRGYYVDAERIDRAQGTLS